MFNVKIDILSGGGKCFMPENKTILRCFIQTVSTQMFKVEKEKWSLNFADGRFLNRL